MYIFNVIASGVVLTDREVEVEKKHNVGDKEGRVLHKVVDILEVEMHKLPRCGVDLTVGIQLHKSALQPRDEPINTTHESHKVS